MTGEAGARRPSILELAWPVVLSFWMRSLFNFVDAAFAATISDAAVAGIGLAYPLEFLLIALWVGTSTGTTSLLARAMGARQGERIEQVLAATRRIVLVLVPSFAMLGGCVWWLAPRLAADDPTAGGISAEVARHFQVYGTVIVTGSAFTAFWAVLPDSIVKAHHDTRSTMWAGIWSNVVNVALNALFLFVFHWGVFGIALSTVIGRLAGLAYALRRARTHETERRATGLDVVQGLLERPYRAMAALAVPAAVTYGLVGLEPAAVNVLLAREADATESVAAFSVHVRWVFFFLMPVIATNVALLPYVARRSGEGDMDGVRRAFREVTRAAAAYVVLLVLPVTYFFAEWLVKPFAVGDVTRELAAFGVRVVPLATLVAIPFMACRGVFEGLQRGTPGLFVAVLRYVVLTIPCAVAGGAVAEAVDRPALHGVLLGLVASTAIASGVFLAWMRRALGGGGIRPVS